jgi:hypothetical protein
MARHLRSEIKRLIRKRDRIYKKLKSTRVEERTNIIKKHRSAKHLVQQKLRQSYWNYIENIIIENSKLAESKPSKKLWCDFSLFSSQMCDSFNGLGVVNAE